MAEPEFAIAPPAAGEPVRAPQDVIMALSGHDNEYSLNNNRTLSPPWDANYPAPWHLPSRLYRFPIEVGYLEADGRRAISLMHPELGDHPFIREIEARLGVRLNAAGAPNEYGVGKTDSAAWWHAVDLMTDKHWRALLKTGRFTTKAAMLNAVGFAVRYRHLALDAARQVMAALGAPEPDQAEMERLLRALSPPSLSQDGKTKWWPINEGAVRDSAAVAWLFIGAMERRWFVYDRAGHAGWSELGRQVYAGEAPAVEPAPAASGGYRPPSSRTSESMAFMANRVTALTDSADLFLTPPWGFRAVAEIIRQVDPAARTVAEPACGPGLGVHGLKDYFEVFASDAYDYGWGHAVFDFLDPATAYPFHPDWNVTTPPIGRKVEPFIRAAYRRARRGVAMLLQLRSLEGIGRHALFDELALSRVCPFAERITLLEGRYDPTKSTATAYVWLLFIKPQRRGQAPDRSGQRIPIPPGSRDRLMRLSDLRFAVSDQPMPASVLPPIGTRWIEERHLDSLAALSACPKGASATGGLMGSVLAALVEVFGLASREIEPRLGDYVYSIRPEGMDLLRHMGRLPAKAAA